MKNVCRVIFLSFICIITSAQVTASAAQHEKNYFQFEVANYHTQRQSGQTLNLYIRFAYKEGLDPSEYVDYRKMRDQAIEYLEPSEKFPTNVFWEIIATDIARQLLKKYPLDAISVQMEVLDNAAGGEPGDHGPIVTIGDIAPLNIHH